MSSSGCCGTWPSSEKLTIFSAISPWLCVFACLHFVFETASHYAVLVSWSWKWLCTDQAELELTEALVYASPMLG